MFTIRNHKLSTKNQNLKTKWGKKLEKKNKQRTPGRNQTKSKNEKKTCRQKLQKARQLSI